MATCQQCNKYESNWGPARSSYCSAYRAKINDSKNEEGGKEFAKYFNMGWKATKECPHGWNSPDYD